MTKSVTELRKWEDEFENYKTLEDFVEFISSEGYWLQQDKHPNFQLSLTDVKNLIYKYLEIDPVKLEQERRQLLADVLTLKEKSC